SFSRDWSSDVCSSDLEQRGTALDPVHLVTLAQEQFGQVRAVLPRDARDKSTLHHYLKPALVRMLPRFPGDPASSGSWKRPRSARSEERRVGNECRCRR